MKFLASPPGGPQGFVRGPQHRRSGQVLVRSTASRNHHPDSDFSPIVLLVMATKSLALTLTRLGTSTSFDQVGGKWAWRWDTA